MIVNPVLPGFHPDPSILRVGARYVIATSTFEWFPGVALHTSTDLQTWHPAGHVLHSREQLDLRGVPDSAGIWAPALSFSDGRYWLIYTVVRTMTGPHKDLDNFLVTAPSLDGPWSEPIYLNSSGFDPSLYHAPDGRRYLINVNWDHRADHFSFGGVLLQEYDHEARSLIGHATVIFRSNELMEGSHLFERDGWFYLMLAEGGTGYNHGIRLARARDLGGPYEVDPEPLLTSRDDATLRIAKAGHGQLVSAPSGEEYVVHLGARPVMGRDGLRCPLGRETFLQQVVWSTDGWLRLADGGHHPSSSVYQPALAGPTTRDAAAADGVDVEPFRGPEWVSLRVPVDQSWVDHTAAGRVRLRGRESLESLFDQSMLARRLPSLHCSVAVTVDVAPEHFTQLAGLVVYYNTTGYHYLAVTHDEDLGRVVGVISRAATGVLERGFRPVPTGPIRLRLDVDGLGLRFLVGTDDGWQPLGVDADLDPLSDEIGPPLRFTGTMIGVCAHDLGRRRLLADFSDFTLEVASAAPS